MFRKEENRCEDILREIAEKHGIGIMEISIMPDHIHLIVDIPPTMSVSEAFRLLKGASSYRLFRKKPNFRKRYPRGHFWSPGKFYRSVGDADLETPKELCEEPENGSSDDPASVLLRKPRTSVWGGRHHLQ